MGAALVPFSLDRQPSVQRLRQKEATVGSSSSECIRNPQPRKVRESEKSEEKCVQTDQFGLRGRCVPPHGALPGSAHLSSSALFLRRTGSRASTTQSSIRYTGLPERLRAAGQPGSRLTRPPLSDPDIVVISVVTAFPVFP